MSTVPVVEARQVVKRYGATTALDHADLTVLPGQTHALVGRNGAGKSTLVAVLTGLTAPDSGSLLMNGEPVPRLSERDGWRSRVACVYQRSTIIPDLSVAENLFLNRQETLRGFVRWSAVRRAATQLLERWSVDVDVRRPAGELGVEQRQFIEIARSLSFGARFVILDEPTAQLDGGAITRLFGHIAELQRQGVTFLFISHHLQEVYDICDTVTVYRDARHVLTAPVADLPKPDLVAAMTGENAVVAEERASSARRGPAVLRVRELSLAPHYAGVSFEVAPGEIVGLAGAGGSGKTEVAETLAGLRAADSGTVDVGDHRPRPGDVPAALAAGLGFVPEDRHHQGLVPGMSVADNTTLSVMDRLGPGIFVRSGLRDRLAGTMIDRLEVKTPGPGLAVSALSGGNQQKVVMARALAGDPRVLVLITPTAGVDVRSKEFLLGKVAEAAAGGTAVLIASDELDDLRLCDRVLVLVHGRLTTGLAAGWRDHEVVAAMEGVDLDA
ncbi:sugar ABC transporter ATP-binding protein [Amycolatopsis sp. cmx-4-83]|uniref:sugar ABC transporter ATP-binding protein n=1 Tax=Amycolatopsis sp. cmx-4-83 TaxID=2790940 RepID=UPI00397AA8D8